MNVFTIVIPISFFPNKDSQTYWTCYTINLSYIYYMGLLRVGDNLPHDNLPRVLLLSFMVELWHRL